MTLSSRVFWSSTCATLLVCADAAAQPSGPDAATAQALFEEGKRLMGEKNYQEGCPKLAESQRLDPAGGTLLAIALCHEAEGKTATAWGDFNLALTEARRDGRADRAAAATGHIRALEHKLTRLTISVGVKADGLEIRRDGATIGQAQWSTPLPIDPGTHTIEASAPGKKPWRQAVEVRGEGTTLELQIPALLEEDKAPAASPPVAANSPAPIAAPPESSPPPPQPRTPARETPAASDGNRILWAAITGGVGLAATGIGAAFGISASSKWSETKGACTNGACTNAAALKTGQEAGNTADFSTIFFVIGGVGLVTSAAILVLAPRSSSGAAVRVAPVVGHAQTGLAVTGAF